MSKEASSDTRTTADFVLFGLGFAGFWLSATAVVIASPGVFITGVLLFLISVAGFAVKQPQD